EVRGEHIRDIQVVFNDEDDWFCFLHDTSRVTRPAPDNRAAVKQKSECGFRSAGAAHCASGPHSRLAHLEMCFTLSVLYRSGNRKQDRPRHGKWSEQRGTRARRKAISAPLAAGRLP